MVQEIRSLQKLAIFFRVSRWGRRGGGGGGLYVVLYGMKIFGYTVYTQLEPSSKHWVIDCMLSGLSLLYCSPFTSDRLAAVRIEGIKGEVTVMSNAAYSLPIEDKYIRWPGMA